MSNESESTLCKLDLKKIKILRRWCFIAWDIDMCNTEINSFSNITLVDRHF